MQLKPITKEGILPRCRKPNGIVSQRLAGGREHLSRRVEIDPSNQEALVSLLSRSRPVRRGDRRGARRAAQSCRGSPTNMTGRTTWDRLRAARERAAHAALGRRSRGGVVPRGDDVVREGGTDAPRGNDESILRWNTCVRMISTSAYPTQRVRARARRLENKQAAGARSESPWRSRPNRRSVKPVRAVTGMRNYNDRRRAFLRLRAAAADRRVVRGVDRYRRAAVPAVSTCSPARRPLRRLRPLPPRHPKYRDKITFDVRRVGYMPSRYGLPEGGDTTLEVLMPVARQLGPVRTPRRRSPRARAARVQRSRGARACADRATS